MLEGGINGRKRSFGKLTTPIGDFDWLGAQSNYMVSTLKDPTMLRWPRCKTRQHPKYAKRMQKVCKIYSNVCKMYANSMQKICKNDAKSIQNLCKKDTVMHCTWHLAKNSTSYCSSEGKTWSDKKISASSQKKFG